MKCQHAILITTALVLTCSNHTTSPSKQTVATETWRIADADYPQDHAIVDLAKDVNGAIACTGNWYYEFFGYNVTCSIMQGTVVKDTTFFTFSCSGTAAYPPDENGNIESSGFFLTMSGQFSSGTASGNWAITFTDPEWNEWAPDGTFNGQRTGGQGVTD